MSTNATKISLHAKSYNAGLNPRGGGGNFVSKGRGCLYYLSRVKKVVLVPLRVLSFKRSTVGALAESFRVFSRKKYDRR